MTSFDPIRYGAAVLPLLEPLPLPSLGPGMPNSAVRDVISSLSPERLIGKIGDRSMALACQSGLWLLHDFLDESHSISQDISTVTGSFWHGIMHRREPDPGNAKYWWRLAGAHPVLEMLKTESPKIGYSYRNPEEFVDLCEQVRGTGSTEENLAKRVQLLEWQLLFDYCFQKAVAG